MKKLHGVCAVLVGLTILLPAGIFAAEQPTAPRCPVHNTICSVKGGEYNCTLSNTGRPGVIRGRAGQIGFAPVRTAQVIHKCAPWEHPTEK